MVSDKTYIDQTDNMDTENDQGAPVHLPTREETTAETDMETRPKTETQIVDDELDSRRPDIFSIHKDIHSNPEGT